MLCCEDSSCLVYPVAFAYNCWNPTRRPISVGIARWPFMLFWSRQVHYLSHTVSHEGIHTDATRSKVIKNLPSSSNLERLHPFLGLAGSLTALNNTEMLFRPYSIISAQLLSLHTLILISYYRSRLTHQGLSCIA